jgi:TonB family protein
LVKKEVPSGPNLVRSLAENRLDSWKEIAAYLRREVRTVQRWEKTAGLPIHRFLVEKHGLIYAFKSELDAWCSGREARLMTVSEHNEGGPGRGVLPRWRSLGALATVMLFSIAAYFVLKSSWFQKERAPSNATSSRIQNIAPEEMWKRVIQCAFPKYPQPALDYHVSGTVDLGLGISPEGGIDNFRVLEGKVLLVDAAVEAIRQWHFRPNVFRGEITWTRVRARVRFNDDGTTSVDLEPAILADDFGNPGTLRSAITGVARPASLPACKSVQPGAEPGRKADVALSQTP